MRTYLLTVAMTSALILSGCSSSDKDGEATPATSATPTPTTTGNPWGEAPAKRADFKPNTDHDVAVTDPLLFSLDPCKLLTASGVKKLSPWNAPHGCTPHYDNKTAVSIELARGFGEDQREEAERRITNGVVNYLDRDSDGCDSVLIPTSFNSAIEISANYQDTDPCGTLNSATEKILTALTTKPASLQSSVLTASNLPPCALLGSAWGELKSDEVLGGYSSRIGQCTVTAPNEDDYPEVQAELQIGLTEVARPLETDQMDDECTARGPGWAQPDALVSSSGRRGATATIEVTLKGTCNEASDLYKKVLAESKSKQPSKQTISADNRFWYTAEESDRAVVGGCLNVAEALRIECMPAAEVTVPDTTIAAFRAAAVNPDVTCEMVKDTVAETFPDLDQRSTGIERDTGVCIFTDTAGTTELRIGASTRGYLSFADSTTVDGIEQGPISSRFSYEPKSEGWGVRSEKNSTALSIEMASSKFPTPEEVQTQLKPLSSALVTQVLTDN